MPVFTAPQIQIIVIFFVQLKPTLSSHSVILYSSYEGDPLSPPKGEATQGEHPLDPFFIKEYYFNLIRGIAICGMPQRRGLKAR